MTAQNNPDNVSEPIVSDEEVHYRRSCIDRDESRDGSNEDNFDSKLANQWTEHEKLEKTVCETIYAQDITHTAGTKAKTADVHGHGEEKWLDSGQC